MASTSLRRKGVRGSICFCKDLAPNREYQLLVVGRLRRIQNSTDPRPAPGRSSDLREPGEEEPNTPVPTSRPYFGITLVKNTLAGSGRDESFTLAVLNANNGPKQAIFCQQLAKCFL